MHDPESSANPRVDLRANCVPDPPREQKRPCLVSVEPCVKDTLGHGAELTAEANAGGTQCRAWGTLDDAREAHVTISLRERATCSWARRPFRMRWSRLQS